MPALANLPLLHLPLERKSLVIISLPLYLYKVSYKASTLGKHKAVSSSPIAVVEAPSSPGLSPEPLPKLVRKHLVPKCCH